MVKFVFFISLDNSVQQMLTKSTRLELYDQKPNFMLHSCSSYGKLVGSTSQELCTTAVGIHRTRPSCEIDICSTSISLCLTSWKLVYNLPKLIQQQAHNMRAGNAHAHLKLQCYESLTNEYFARQLTF